MKEGDTCTYCHTQKVEKTTENKGTIREQTYLICPNCCSTYIEE